MSASVGGFDRLQLNIGGQDLFVIDNETGLPLTIERAAGSDSAIAIRLATPSEQAAHSDTLAEALWAADRAIVGAARTLDALMMTGNKHFGIASNEGAAAALELHTAIEGGADYLAYLDRHTDKRLTDERVLADELAALLAPFCNPFDPACRDWDADDWDAAHVRADAALTRHRAARQSPQDSQN